MGLYDLASYVNSIEPVAVTSRFQWIYAENAQSISFAKYNGCSVTDVDGIT
jgi:hypothetical protein